MAKARAISWPSVEDLDLFHKVLADVTPLRPDPVPTPPPPPPPPPLALALEGKPAAGKERKTDGKKTPAKLVTRQTPPPDPIKPVFPAALVDHGAGRTPGLDKRSALRLQRGKTEIDGRIDLHGMTQIEARSALTGFVTNGHRHGRRCLLVITGKGRPTTNAPNHPWGGERPHEPGVIRRMVPFWLKEPPLVECVLAYSPAQPRDGGSGALYVLLKRRRAS